MEDQGEYTGPSDISCLSLIIYFILLILAIGLLY